MSIRDDFFAAKAKGSLWDVAVSIKRGNPLPLDADSIFESYAALEAYAADVLAYPGQVVAVVNADSTGIYYLDQNLAIQPVGVIPTGDKAIDVTEDGKISARVDNVTIKVNDDNNLEAIIPECPEYVGDDLSIEIAGNKVSMHDFGKAFYKYIPEVKDEETGETTSEARYERVEVSETNLWKAGLEPKVVTEEGKLVIGWFEPNPTTIEGVNDQVTAVQGTVADLETSVGAPSTEGSPATGLYKEVEDVQEDVKNLTDEVGTSDDALGENVNTLWAHVNSHESRIGAIETDYLTSVDKAALEKEIDDLVIVDEIKYNSETKLIQLYSNNTAVGTGFDASDFIVDGMIDSVELATDNGKTGEDKVEGQFLKITWNTDAGKNDVYLDITHLVDAYTAGNGLELTDNKFSVIIDKSSENFLEVSGTGIKISGVSDAIAAAQAAAEATAAADATSKADAAKQAAIDDAATKYATTDALEAVSEVAEAAVTTSEMGAYVTDAIKDKADKATTLEGYGITDAYTKTKVDELINAINAGNQESAGAVSTRLETYITNNDSRVEVIENKLDTVEENAEVNIIEVVKVNNSALTVSAEDRSVNIEVPTKVGDLSDWGAVDTRITAAKSQADTATTTANQADTKASANAESITDHESRISSLETSKADHLSRITALEQHDASHTAEFNALNTAVQGNSTEIANLKAGKADTTVTDALAGRITTNENAIKALNETTIPGINGEIANKANTADVYTKTKIGTIPDDKTLVEMISEAQSAATYDDTQVKADIAANTKAIGDLTNGAVKNNTDAIAQLIEDLDNVSNIMNFRGVVSPAEENPNIDSDVAAAGITDLKDGDVIIYGDKEYVYSNNDWVEFGDASGNANAITALDERLTTAEGKLTPEAEKNTIVSVSLGSEDALTPDANRNVAIPIALQTALGVVKSSPEATYSEGTWSGENKIMVAEDGTMEVNKVNVNKLVQNDGDYLILDGGSATDAPTE